MTLHLTAARLTNFRCFRDATVELHQRLTVFVADNGMGKSALLDALVIGMAEFGHTLCGIGTAPGLAASDVRVATDRDDGDSRGDDARTSIALAADIGGRSVQWELSRKRGSSRMGRAPTRLAELYEATADLRQRADGDPITLPIVVHYSSTRFARDTYFCGKHKDKCDRFAGPRRTFDPDDLIDPSIVDPEEFLEFLPDGTVRPRHDLSSRNEHMAAETLRVFQLADSAFLRRSREDAVRPYVHAIDTLLPFGSASLKSYLESVQAEIDDAPFSTAIRHYLRGLLP